MFMWSLGTLSWLRLKGFGSWVGIGFSKILSNGCRMAVYVGIRTYVSIYIYKVDMFIYVYIHTCSWTKKSNDTTTSAANALSLRMQCCLGLRLLEPVSW